MRILAIPVKSLAKAKTRLAPVLSPMERAALTLAMLEDVLDAALPVPGWESWVVSPDEAALEIAAQRGARPVPEEKPPLASAIRQIEAEATELDADALAVLLADLPLVTPEVLQAALRTLGTVVLAPSTGDGGTNLLLRRPPRAIGARFGRDSFAKHRASADSRGFPAAIVSSPELTVDLDVPEDIVRVVNEAKAGRTLTSLLELDAVSRVAALV